MPGFRQFMVRTAFSQASALTTLIFTNFLEVAKIRLISDAGNCSKSHFQSKTITNRILRKYFSQSYSIAAETSACYNCLPERNALLLILHLIREQGYRYVFFSGISNSIYSHLIRTGMFFPIFELFKVKTDNLCSRLKSNGEVYSATLASIMTRTVTSALSFPLEISKIRRQSAGFKINEHSIIKSSQEIYKNPAKYFSAFLQFYKR